MDRNKRRWVLASLLVALFAIVATGIVFRDGLVDEWLIIRLRYGAEAGRDEVVHSLGDRQVARAVPYLIEALAKEDERDRFLHSRRKSSRGGPEFEFYTNSHVMLALFDIGDPSKKAVLAKVETPRDLTNHGHLQSVASIEGLAAVFAMGGPLTFADKPPIHTQLEYIEL